MRKLKATLACFIVFAIGCHRNQPQMQPMVLQLPAPTVQTCTSVDGLPDPICTHGAVRSTEAESICHGGSTRQYRPPTSYTNPLKRQGIASYGYADTNMADYEEDHLISLKLGGDGKDPKNLWPEPHAGENNSFDKDKVENWLHKQVCSGAMTPQDAQDGIRTGWRQYLRAAQGKQSGPPDAPR